jgi:hypothetical protein
MKNLQALSFNFKNNWFLITLVMFSLSITPSCSDDEPDVVSAVKTEEEGSVEGNAKALELVRKEKKVDEAIITDANVLYVSVQDDGSRRDGFASYLCEILRENKAKARWVKITRTGSTNAPDRDNAFGVLLGESRCK